MGARSEHVCTVMVMGERPELTPNEPGELQIEPRVPGDLGVMEPNDPGELEIQPRDHDDAE